MREASFCKVKCRITPEHKVHDKGYPVTVVINEDEEEIIDCRCHSCAASEGGCKHGVALIFWLLRKSLEPSVTSVECYWRKPTLSKVGTVLKATKLVDIFKKGVPVPDPQNTAFLNKVIDKGLKSSSLGVLFEYFKTCESNTEKVSLFNLANYFMSDCGNVRSAESFIEFCKKEITKDMCDEVQKATKEQSRCNTWFDVRFARITASKLHEAAHCNTLDGAVTEAILGAAKFKTTGAMERGLNLEDKVLQVICEKKKISFEKVGMFLNKDYPIFGASPDAVSTEIKCPSKDKTVELYIKDGNIMKKPFAQIQLQMFLANKCKGLFCIASPNFENNMEVSIHEICLDKTFCIEVMEQATKFWKKAIFPKLIS